MSKARGDAGFTISVRIVVKGNEIRKNDSRGDYMFMPPSTWMTWPVT